MSLSQFPSLPLVTFQKSCPIPLLLPQNWPMLAPRLTATSNILAMTGSSVLYLCGPKTETSIVIIMHKSTEHTCWAIYSTPILCKPRAKSLSHRFTIVAFCCLSLSPMHFFGVLHLLVYPASGVCFPSHWEIDSALLPILLCWRTSFLCGHDVLSWQTVALKFRRYRLSDGIRKQIKSMQWKALLFLEWF